jgi:hypothetical protein
MGRFYLPDSNKKQSEGMNTIKKGCNVIKAKRKKVYQKRMGKSEDYCAQSKLNS